MHASTSRILRKSRMRRRARTDLCGGRSVMSVPTATVILSGWARSLCTSLPVLGNRRCGKLGFLPILPALSCKRVASSPLNPFSLSTNAAPSVRTDSDLINYLTNYPFRAIKRREIRPPAPVAALPQDALRPVLSLELPTSNFQPPIRSPFVFIFLRIAFPATPLFSHSSALPRG